MNRTDKYDPEDIESLLMHKQFNELYAEEKEFVLRHVENEEEYESLRKTLYDLHDAAGQVDLLEPDPSIRENLLAEFAVESKNGFVTWLNQLFAMPGIEWYQQRGMRYALVVASVVVLGIFIWPSVSENRDQAIAEVKTESKNETMAPGDSVLEEKNLFAEKLENPGYPPAPKVIKNPSAEAEVFETHTESENGPARGSVATENSITEDLSAPPVAEEPVSDIADDNASVVKKLPPVQPEVSENVLKKSEEKDEVSLSAVTIQSMPTAVGGISEVSISSTDSFTKFTPLIITSRPASDLKDVLDILYTAQ